MVALPEEHRSAWRSVSYFVLRWLLRRRQITARVAPLDLRVRAYARDVLGRHLYKRGTHERELTRYVLQELPLRDDAVILDIGANLGWYSLLLARRCPRARIHAFEPEPRNLELLRTNLRENRIDNVTVHAAAVAERSGTMQLYPYAEKNMGRHSLVPMADVQPIDVPTVSIDDFLVTHSIAPEAVDFVKLDVEGYELPALRGARRLLAARPVVLAEFAPKYMKRAGIDPREFLDLLAGAGFAPHRLRAAVLQPFAAGDGEGDQRLDLIWLKTG